MVSLRLKHGLREEIENWFSDCRLLKKKGVFSEQTLLPGMICRLQSIHKNRVLKAQKARKPVQTLQGMDGWFLSFGEICFNHMLIPVVDRPCLALVRQCRKKNLCTTYPPKTFLDGPAVRCTGVFSLRLLEIFAVPSISLRFYTHYDAFVWLFNIRLPLWVKLIFYFLVV